jgi:chaperone modulatory protein CbpM
MRVEILHTTGVEELRHYTLTEVAACSGLSEVELRDLADVGILEPLDRSGAQWIFAGTSINLARVARRLRTDFELDASGAALAVQLVARIRELEHQLRSLEARLPGRIE